MNNWAIQWKMGFNLDPSKQAPEVMFSRKLQKTNHIQFISITTPFNYVGMYIELN